MSDEQAPECCPFCGAEEYPHIMESLTYANLFRCGTRLGCRGSRSRTDQSHSCVTAERERLTRERDEAKARVASAIAERNTARARAEQVWKLREEFVALLGTDDIQRGVETVKGLLARVKRLEEAGDECSRYATGQARDDWNAAKEATP